MANDQRKPKSWMNPVGGGAKTPTSQKRGWHPTTQAAKPTEPRKRSRLLPALAAAVLLAGIVVALLLLRGYRPGRVVLVAPANTGTMALSHNWTGFNSARELARFASEGRAHPKVVQEPVDSVNPDNWASALDGPEEVFAVFFCLHGGTDSKGAYFWLMPPEAGSPDEKYKLRLTRVLDKLAEFPKKKKVLFVDATQVTASLPQGMLHNDFAHELRKLDGRIHDIPNFVVICASDEDQRSWCSEEWQRTVFAHFLVEGARGAAKTDRVSVEKLFNFVKDKVSAWVRSNREQDQVPFLLPSAGGIEMAKDIELASVSSSSYEADPPPGAKFEAPPELEKAWELCEEIAKSSPQANAPHLWRRHLDMTLRVESLLRAGASVADVQKLLSNLRDNKAPLTTRSWANLGSLSNSVAMPAAVSAVPPKPLIDRKLFLDLWADPAKVWEQVASSVGPAELPQLRLDVCAHLVDFLIHENRPEYLNQSAGGTKQKPGLLSLMFSGSIAPVEAQLLLILDRDLDREPNKPQPDWKTLQLAIETHRLAEEVALLGGAASDELPHSELVFPWIKKEIALADVERLRGDDLLISNNPADWSKAAGRLGEAKRQYLDIHARAAQIRAALDARNKALSELPYFARWVAGLRDEFADDADRPEKLLKLVESIAADMHLLASMLEGNDSSALAKLTVTTKRAQAGLDELRQIFFASLENLGAKERPSKWRHIDNALQVPFIKAGKRTQLLASLRRISESLNANFENVTTPPPPPTKSADLAQERALRQGRLALALLGSTWVDDTTTQDDLKGIVKYKFDVLQKMMAPSPTWRDTVAEAGEQLGWHWRTLATRVDTLTDKANREALEPALKSLARADTLARLTDSATAFTTERAPAADYQRHRLHWFLLDQARRTIEANWAAADPAAEKAGRPSFAEETGRRFVKDAEDLIMMGAAKVPSEEDNVRLKQEVRPLKALVDKLPTIAVRATPRNVSVTSRQKIGVRFSIQTPAGQAAGYPVSQYHPTGPCKLLSNPATRSPMSVFVDQNQRDVDVPVEVNLETSASKEPRTVVAELWHRGHRPSDTVNIIVEDHPSGSLVHLPPQGDAAIIPRAGEDMRKGTVGIVLDWTRSMIIPGPNKYGPAVNALEALLAGLPPETNIAFMQFGEPDDSTKDKMAYPEPIRGSFCGDLHAAERQKLIKKLRENEPDAGHTPLARAVLTMAQYLSQLDTPGVKTMVVLTDGEDNVPQLRGEKWEPGKWLVEELKDFPVVVNMVFFLAGNEEKSALQQFEPILRTRPPGALYTAQSQDELITNLRDALIPRIVILDEEGQPVRDLETKGRDGVKVLPKGSGLKNPIRLPAGSYGLRTARADLTKIVLTPGDRLMVEPYYKGSRVAIRSMPYIDVVPKDYRKLRDVSEDAADLQAAVADAHLVTGKAENREYDLELIVLMERNRAADPLHVTRPDFAWIEVRADGDDPSGPARMAWMENANYFPCPAWKVMVPNWPRLPGKDTALQGCPKPVITAYWVHTWPIGQPVVREAGKDFAEIFKGTVRIGEENIEIGEVRFDGDTLIVDLSHKPGVPLVFVRTEGLKPAPRLSLEEDHRFFDKAGKYTARFSKVDENRRGQKFSLVFYSMAQLKNMAAKVVVRPEISLDTKQPLGQVTPGPIILTK